MNPYKNRSIVELLQMDFNEEIFDTILGIIEQKQNRDLGSHRSHREDTQLISA